MTNSHHCQTHPYLCQGAAHGQRQVDHAQSSRLDRQLGACEGLMCHCGSLSMTWQLSYPHHHSPGAEGDDMRGFNLGGSGGDIMTLLHKASHKLHVQVLMLPLPEQSRDNKPLMYC